MIKRAVMAPLLSLGAASAFAVGSVKAFTPASGELKTPTGAEHLLSPVGQLQLSNSWWPGAVINEERATTEAGCQQQALLVRLAALVAEESGDDAAAINALRQQIQALKVVGRRTINLDPDVVRVSERDNSSLQGNYTLWVGVQSTHITSLGLLSHPGRQPFMSGRDVASYLDGRSRLSGADRSFARVIYPDGRTQRVPAAYWNKRHVESTLSSIIYVGLFGTVRSSTLDEVNADILRTLIQRISE